MKVLVFGGRGWIGQQLVNLMNVNNIDYVLSSTRADNYKLVSQELLAISPTHVISLVGRTYGKGFNTIDYLEQEGKLKENINDNLFAPTVLALLCKEHNIHFTYFGTGCIFNQDNPESKSYTEEDKPDFFGSSYSIVKGYTDQIMHILEDSVLNLRIRMPITDRVEPRNFITKITKYEKICSIKNSMSVLPDLLPIVIDMMKNKLTGTFNLVNPGIISHNEILELYKEIVDNNFNWVNMTIEEQNQILLSKRSNNQLDNSKTLNHYPTIPHIKTSIIKCLGNMKSSGLNTPTTYED
jgi:3,5-epimerase/4-reductase